jgi:hypothetical protein
LKQQILRYPNCFPFYFIPVCATLFRARTLNALTQAFS